MRVLAGILIGCISSIGLCLIGCESERAGEQISETRLQLGTVCTITINGADYSLLEAAFELCGEYEALFSMSAEGSDVWRINHAAGEAVAVSLHTIEVIKQAIAFGELSEGMFDITIGRLSRLWDFGENENTPSAQEIEAARKSIDYRQVNIDGNTVQLANPNAWIDLGAIAKGYIADRIIELITENGVENALVNLGGDIVAIGYRPDGRPWRSALRKPFGADHEYIGVLEMTNVSIVSSGTYERQFEVSGVVYHHILDPNTGMPSRSDIIGATVVAENAMIGDGLSTIAVLVGSERAGELFERSNGFIGAVLVLESGEVVTVGDVLVN